MVWLRDQIHLVREQRTIARMTPSQAQASWELQTLISAPLFLLYVHVHSHVRVHVCMCIRVCVCFWQGC